MLAHQRVVVSNDTTGLWVILVVVKLLQGQIREFALVLLDVKDIGVCVHILEAVGVDFQKFLEPI